MTYDIVTYDIVTYNIVTYVIVTYDIRVNVNVKIKWNNPVYRIFSIDLSSLRQQLSNDIVATAGRSKMERRPP